MEFNEQQANKNSIIAINQDDVILANTTLKIPCFISANYCQEVVINNITDINKIFLFPLINKDEIDLLIIGTGKVASFLSPKQQIDINHMNIGFENMNNKSACSSFNLLLADRRKAGLLLL